MSALRLSLFVITSLVIAGACSCDPVHSDAVADLGDEAPGVGPGPVHRPGQPCVTCHGGSGPGSPQWSIAGTVYETEYQTAPLVDAQIVVTDATGASRTLPSNSVGNFYISTDDWSPVYPLHVELQSNGTVVEMKSRIGGTGSCADCHRGDGSNAQMPAVYLRTP